MNIGISVRGKIAVLTDAVTYICGNSDYIIKFDFDAEWDAYEAKTARFRYGNSYTDVVFSGNECAVPVIDDALYFYVGVYAGDLHTTTPVMINSKKSILSGTGLPADPPDDVYVQLMQMLESGEIKGEKGDPGTAGADGKDGAGIDITGATVGQIAKIAAVDDTGKPTAWEAVDMPSGGGGGVTTLHINVTAVNKETKEATFTADKTIEEMQQAAANGPIWCVVSFLAGVLSEEALTLGIPPVWGGVAPTFGEVALPVHNEYGNNAFIYAVRGIPSKEWILDLGAFGS